MKNLYFIVIFVSSPASKMPKTSAKPCYRLVGDLNSMQGAIVRVPLAP